MDVAYDRVNEESLPSHAETPEGSESGGQRGDDQSGDLNQEVRDVYKSFSESTWGVKIGGLWGTVRKQGEQYAQRAQQELAAASSEASKGFSGLVNQTQSVNLNESSEKSTKATDTSSSTPTDSKATKAAPESLLADIGKEAQSIFGHFRSDASKIAEERLKQVRAAEDAADEALLKFGTNIKSFLRDAIVITAPDGDGKSEVLFESKDSEGRRKVHATRFDAQLHVIHTTLASFTQDPASDEYAKWKPDFGIDKKTDDIASDLNKYKELRQAMEKLVPEQVEYAQFWTRYYFLRHVIETEEQKRRELLKSQVDEEEVAWDDDDEDESSTPNNERNKAPEPSSKGAKPAKNDLLKPTESRKSNEHSVADSDASYDLVSGATSRGPGSPKEAKEAKTEVKKKETVAEESDEDDWE